MEVTGELKEVSRDWKTNKIVVSFAINENLSQETLDNISNCKLAIEAKKWREKRSLDANALLWVCLDKIAKAMTPPADKWDIYLLMLKRYGKFTYICVKPNVVDAVKAQWRECEVVGEIEINGQKAVQMLCYFGSSLLDSKEFSDLLSGVIEEMRQMGLETPTSKEMRLAIERLEKR